MRRLSRFRPSGLGRPLTLLRAFLVASAVIRAVGAVALSSQLSHDLRAASLADTADDTTTYTDAVLAPRLVRGDAVRATPRRLRALVRAVDLPADMRGLNVYARDGRLVFSTTHADRIGRHLPARNSEPSSPRTSRGLRSSIPRAVRPRSSGCGRPCTARRGDPVGGPRRRSTLPSSTTRSRALGVRSGTRSGRVCLPRLALAIFVSSASARMRAQNEDQEARSHDLVESSRGLGDAARDDRDPQCRRRSSRPVHGRLLHSAAASNTQRSAMPQHGDVLLSCAFGTREPNGRHDRVDCARNQSALGRHRSKCRCRVALVGTDTARSR